jgi:hypothetical protein
MPFALLSLVACARDHSAEDSASYAAAYETGCTVGAADGPVDGEADGKACEPSTYSGADAMQVVDYCPEEEWSGEEEDPCIYGWWAGYRDCYGDAYDSAYAKARAKALCD